MAQYSFTPFMWRLHKTNESRRKSLSHSQKFGICLVLKAGDPGDRVIELYNVFLQPETRPAADSIFIQATLE